MQTIQSSRIYFRSTRPARRAVALSFIGFVFLAASLAPASAQDKPQDKDKPKDGQAAYDPKSAPGAGQKFLEKFAGQWDVEKIFHPQTGEPTTTKGECRQTMINDGRFLRSEFTFHNGTNNVTGIGLIGFEPATGFFTSIWADSHSAKMSIRQSKEPFDGKEIIMNSVALAGGTTRESRPSRNVTQLVEDGHKIIHQQYASGTNGTERLMMELIMTKTGD